MPDMAQASASPATGPVVTVKPTSNDLSVRPIPFSMPWYCKGRVIGVCVGCPDDVGWEMNVLHSQRAEGDAD